MTSTQTKQITIVWDSTVSAYRMTSPWIKELKEFMSAQMPHSDRDWDANTKTWTFVEKQLPNVQNLLKLLGLTATVMLRQQVEAAQQQQQQQANTHAQAVVRNAIEPVVMQFVRTVPYDAMKKAYLLASLALHPDKVGGDGTQQATLNTAWQRIEKEIYGK
jgi:hypothetical protein